MKYFLDKLQTRKINLIKLVKNNYPNSTISRISKELNCSSQTLITTIDSLAEDIESFEITTVKIYVVGKFVKAEFNANFSLDSLTHEYLKKSFEYRVILDCYFNRTKSTSEYARDFFLSQASTYRKINDVKEVLANFNLELQQSGNLQIIGKEKLIRYFYYSFFWETRSSANWPFEFDKDLVNEIHYSFISNKFLEENRLINDNKLELWYAIILTRIAAGNYIETISEIQQLGMTASIYQENKEKMQDFFKELSPEISLKKCQAEVDFCFSITLVNMHYLTYDPQMDGLLESIAKKDQIYKTASYQFTEDLDNYLSKSLEGGPLFVLLANLFSVHLYCFLFDGNLSPFVDQLEIQSFDRIYPSFYKMLSKTYVEFISHKEFAEIYHNKELLFQSYMLILFISVDVQNYTEPIYVYLYSSHSRLLEFLLKKELKKMGQYYLIFVNEVTENTDLILADTFNIPFNLIQERTLIWDSVPSDSDWANLRSKLSEIKKKKEFSRLG
ncbi:helix-turn-helix domain-containing protein [Carnobacterium gallinarum]|uniref:helix-turn-helix domain-containing protein n=1 Tax=Carnobacterium gallinarum TaxID=2749 RepID=UPI00054E34BC|nr:helix-turn-helix domain-containing protein [Carnobacterium gallinarum]